MSVQSTRSNHWRHVRFLVLTTLVASALMAVVPAMATHPLASLTGSDFEIDVDANLKVDDAGKDDWANVDFDPQFDAPSGGDDDSFKGGTKEDTECPSVTTGSIPNNKSDLKSFGLYEEEGDPAFVHFFWSRVQEPSGTTLMDFEFNQSETDCANGTGFKQRTVDDLLVEYAITQGGSTATVTVRKWTGSAWGPAQDLTAVNQATGTINSSPIPDGESAGLGAHDPRTFGEASFNLDIVFGEGECVSFGSVMLKSRSSDSFTSQLKDFIAPLDVEITNCGGLKIKKEDGQGAALAGALFDVWLDGGDGVFGDPDENDASVESDDTLIDSCDTTVYTDDDPPEEAPAADQDGVGDCEFEDLFFGDYWVHETAAPPGYTVVLPNPRLVSLTTDSVVTVTFVNNPEPGRVNISKTDDDGAPLSGITFELWVDEDENGEFDDSVDSDTGSTCTTDAGGDCREDGVSGADRPAFDNLEPGFYCAVEDATTIPSGHGGADPQCFEIEIATGGDTVNLSFENPRLHRVIVIVCHEGDDSLYPSDVTLQGETDADDVTKESVGSSDIGDLDESDLCTLGGAQFDGLGHDDEDLTVDIDDHPTP